MPKTGEPVVIYSAANSQQANLLRNLLEERGIAAWVQNDMIQSAAGELPLGWRGDCQVVVRDADAPEARRLALEFEEQLKADPLPEETGASNYYAAIDQWQEWPQCPECGERRHTRCPLCGMAGDRFPLVDLETTEAGPRVLLMCAACDDPFRPEFYRLCHRCGHDFGHGIRLDAAAGPAGASSAEADRSKLWFVVGGMTLLGAALAAYFAQLLSR